MVATIGKQLKSEDNCVFMCEQEASLSQSLLPLIKPYNTNQESRSSLERLSMHKTPRISFQMKQRNPFY